MSVFSVFDVDTGYLALTGNFTDLYPSSTNKNGEIIVREGDDESGEGGSSVDLGKHDIGVLFIMLVVFVGAVLVLIFIIHRKLAKYEHTFD